MVNAFFHMGGYAQFVWPAYGLVAVGMVWHVVRNSRYLQQIPKLIEQKLRRELP